MFSFSFLATGPSKAGSAGREFVLSFLKNSRFDNKAELKLFITAVENNARVTVRNSLTSYRRAEALRLGETFVVPIPPVCELDSKRNSRCSVIVHASADVAITALNHKLRTTDTSVVYPTTEWGTEYYIVTPLKHNFKEFSVTNGKNDNKVVVFVKRPFRFRGIYYRTGTRVAFNLKPYESVIIESTSDLTGTKVTSDKPVAVFTGHTCTTGFYQYCNHVYEQLLPVNMWGSSFIVPPVPTQSRYDTVYVTASQDTNVNVRSGKRTYSIKLTAGMSKALQTSQSMPLSLQADHGIQVLMFFNGAKKGNSYYDAFLLSVLSTDRYCSHYSLRAIKDFDNKAMIVAPMAALRNLKLNNKPLPRSGRLIPGTKYYWTLVDGNRGNILSSSGAPFALYSLGFSHRNGYGSAGRCVQPGKMHAI